MYGEREMPHDEMAESRIQAKSENRESESAAVLMSGNEFMVRSAQELARLDREIASDKEALAAVKKMGASADEATAKRLSHNESLRDELTQELTTFENFIADTQAILSDTKHTTYYEFPEEEGEQQEAA